ncbi:dehydrogenase [Haloferula helveola]|uniref:Dehydrogenase n=1 Tax=Haloferula helveola TaxID=490095 RepID=A0ABM7RHK5_9BACT|nr:dehydrogenase [Haloferula helveola]
MTPNRRNFLRTSALASTAVWFAPNAKAAPASETLRVAVIGLRGRGKSHVSEILGAKGAKLVAVCDVDPEVLAKTVSDLDRKSVKVTTYSDFRKLCESPEIDAVTIATPNHTHTLISVTAAANGKHVYVEKPVSHCVWEGRQLALAAEKFGVIIQHGFQRRSETAWKDAFEWVRGGELGKLKIARGFCYKPRPSIGKAKGAQLAPEGLDYDLWSGPRMLQPIRRKQFHYDWHWQFPWGNGDLGNQGPHQLDVCRWALDDPKDLPRSIRSFGNRFGHDDDGQWANTQIVALDYEAAPILFEVRGLPKKNLDYKSGMDEFRGQRIGNVIEYEGGALLGGHGARCTAVDSDGKEVRKFSGSKSHFVAWIESIRSGKQDPGLSAESGHLSSALAHLGNISWLLGIPGGDDSDIDDPAVQDALDRMKGHLAANGIDLSKTPMRVGPKLETVPGEEKLTEPWNARAAGLLKDTYRSGFELPI